MRLTLKATATAANGAQITEGPGGTPEDLSEDLAVRIRKEWKVSVSTLVLLDDDKDEPNRHSVRILTHKSLPTKDGRPLAPREPQLNQLESFVLKHEKQRIVSQNERDDGEPVKVTLTIEAKPDKGEEPLTEHEQDEIAATFWQSFHTCCLIR